MMQPRLKHFGWGREGEGLTSAEEAFVFERIEQRFGPLADGEVKPPRLEDLTLQSPRLNPPASPFRPGGYDLARDLYFQKIGATGLALGRIDVVPAPVARGSWLEFAAAVESIRDGIDTTAAHSG